MNENTNLYKIVIDDTSYVTKITTKFSNRKKYVPKDPKKIIAVIPGVIHELYIHNGQRVRKNDCLMILEAMKMYNSIKAPMDGTIKSVYVKVKDMVPKGEVLIEFE